MNVREWSTWEDIRHGEWGKWLAPCVSISPCGGVLVQRRVEPLTDGQWDALDRIPAFLADEKRPNWGWLDGRPVMVDYGINNLVGRGLARMRTVANDCRRTDGSRRAA